MDKNPFYRCVSVSTAVATSFRHGLRDQTLQERTDHELLKKVHKNLSTKDTTNNLFMYRQLHATSISDSEGLLVSQ